MSEEHSDRAPLLLKLALRGCMRRVSEEAETLSQYQALAGNLGWEKVAEGLEEARRSLRLAAEGMADAVEEAALLQTLAASEHAHSHRHTHEHAHPHEHEGEHGHSHQ